MHSAVRKCGKLRSQGTPYWMHWAVSSFPSFLLSSLWLGCTFAAAGVNIDRGRCEHIVAAGSPMSDMTVAEGCNLCSHIVRLGYTYEDYQQSPSILCSNVPGHLEEMCEYYACKLLLCDSFTSKSCGQVLASGQVTKYSPCSAKFVCWNCLQIPQYHVRGCFDDLSYESRPW